MNELKVGRIVEVREIARDGAIMRELWKPATIIIIHGASFTVRMLGDQTLRDLPFDKGNNNLWR